MSFTRFTSHSSASPSASTPSREEEIISWLEHTLQQASIEERTRSSSTTTTPRILKYPQQQNEYCGRYRPIKEVKNGPILKSKQERYFPTREPSPEGHITEWTIPEIHEQYSVHLQDIRKAIISTALKAIEAGRTKEDIEIHAKALLERLDSEANMAITRAPRVKDSKAISNTQRREGWKEKSQMKKNMKREKEDILSQISTEIESMHRETELANTKAKFLKKTEPILSHYEWRIEDNLDLHLKHLWWHVEQEQGHWAYEDALEFARNYLEEYKEQLERLEVFEGRDVELERIFGRMQKQADESLEKLNMAIAEEIVKDEGKKRRKVEVEERERLAREARLARRRTTATECPCGRSHW